MPADGTRLDEGSWVLGDSAAAMWIIVQPDGPEVARVELDSGTGRTWVTASLEERGS